MEQSPTDVEAQTDPPPLSQASTIANGQPQSPLSGTKHWAVVVQGLDESCALSHVTLQHSDTSEQAWARIRYSVRSSSLAKRLTACVLMLFTTIVVGIGTIRHIPTWNSGQKDSRLRVYLEDYSHDWSLTEAFYDPYTILHDITYVADNDRFSIKPSSFGSKHSTQNVIVIRTIVNKTKIAWILILLLTISPGLGVGIGIYTRKAEVGVAVSAGVFALASFLQGLAAWFHG